MPLLALRLSMYPLYFAFIILLFLPFLVSEIFAFANVSWQVFWLIRISQQIRFKYSNIVEFRTGPKGLFLLKRILILEQRSMRIVPEVCLEGKIYIYWNVFVEIYIRTPRMECEFCGLPVGGIIWWDTIRKMLSPRSACIILFFLTRIYIFLLRKELVPIRFRLYSRIVFQP